MLTLSCTDLVLLAQSGQYEVMLYFYAYYYYSYLHLFTVITVHCYTLALLGTAGGKDVGCFRKHMPTPVSIYTQ